jgi:hypothetical protein
MRRLPALVAVLPVLTLAAGCGSGKAPATLAGPSPTTTPVVFPSDAPIPTYTPKAPALKGPHFDTPEVAMRYLADAWNRHDLVSLKHVTDPQARGALEDMRSEATDLRLDHCTFTKARGDYECYFTHGFPRGYKSQGPVGTAEFTVGPADRPGWYMTYFVDCGG